MLITLSSQREKTGEEAEMSRSNCILLDTGDHFPEIEFNTVDGGSLTIPRDFGERWNILFFYRGHW